jgi:hypothetical protein
MQKNDTRPANNLAKGQLWKLRDGYIYIVGQGKRLVQYKMLKSEKQRAVMTRMAGIEALEKFLREHQAEPVAGSSAN